MTAIETEIAENPEIIEVTNGDWYAYQDADRVRTGIIGMYTHRRYYPDSVHNHRLTFYDLLADGRVHVKGMELVFRQGHYVSEPPCTSYIDGIDGKLELTPEGPVLRYQRVRGTV